MSVISAPFCPACCTGGSGGSGGSAGGSGGSGGATSIYVGCCGGTLPTLLHATVTAADFPCDTHNPISGTCRLLWDDGLQAWYSTDPVLFGPYSLFLTLKCTGNNPSLFTLTFAGCTNGTVTPLSATCSPLDLIFQTTGPGVTGVCGCVACNIEVTL